jgi:hypothetical protein
MEDGECRDFEAELRNDGAECMASVRRAGHALRKNSGRATRRARGVAAMSGARDGALENARFDRKRARSCENR